MGFAMPDHHRSNTHRGIITGFLVKLIRESIPASQERLAADLGLDRATVQSWETGRRPFTSIALGQTVAIRNQLARRGADPVLLATLDDAAEADYLLSAVLELDPTRVGLDQHPLGWSVLTHSLTELVHWAVAGRPPALVAERPTTVRRRGPVATAPVLDADQRRAFFTNLHLLADRTAGRDHHLVLHRQACFLAGIDPSRNAATWLTQITTSNSTPLAFHTWTPHWPAARSVATSLAQQGDPEPLRDFIARAHPDDACHLAALNYSAYWVGEIHQRQRDDTFMTDPDHGWRGTQVLRHLVERLHPGHPFLDLNIHNLWALLAARRGLVHDAPSLGNDLLNRGERLLDEACCSAQSRQELTSIIYGLRMDGLTPGGTP